MDAFWYKLKISITIIKPTYNSNILILLLHYLTYIGLVKYKYNNKILSLVRLG